MCPRLHDDEPDLDIGVVRRLLESEVPRLAKFSVKPLSSTGTDNAMFRLGPSLVVRLPRILDAARRLTAELEWLPRLRGRLTVAVPELVHVGEPTDDYPYRWAILTWLAGTDGWAARHHGWCGPEIGSDLATTVRELQATPIENAPSREPGVRGGPLSALDERVQWWLNQADGLIDVPAVTRLWKQCREAADYDLEPALLHGDLIPGNLLLDHGRLSAVIDWGGVGAGDPAQDLNPAWSVLNPAGAAVFRDLLAVDTHTWTRARGFVLEQVIGGIVYYTPRQHPLADVMHRTLDRLLSEP